MGWRSVLLLLFNVVTACGKAKLKAPAPIDGRYRLLYSKFAQLSKSDALVDIEQSGIYLNGSLLPAAPTPRGQELVRSKPP